MGGMTQYRIERDTMGDVRVGDPQHQIGAERLRHFVEKLVQQVRSLIKHLLCFMKIGSAAALDHVTSQRRFAPMVDSVAPES